MLSDRTDPDQAAAPKHPCGADGRVACERDLAGGREDAHLVAGPITSDVCRGGAPRLGQFELPRERLELARTEVRRSMDDGQRVAGERAAGEDIDDVVAQHTI